jgi:UDP-2,3-diacylglucosamine pyrophosphatase LpxH
MSNTLFISDLHIPFQHSQAFRFLRELKREYKPTLIVNVGDEVDCHAILKIRTG